MSQTTERVPMVVYITPEFPEGRVSFSVAETARLLGVGQHAVRKAIENDELFAKHFNDRGLVIPTWSIETFLDAQPTIGPDEERLAELDRRLGAIEKTLRAIDERLEITPEERRALLDASPTET